MGNINLSTDLKKYLNKYTGSLEKGLRKLTDKGANELRKSLRHKSPSRTSRYSKEWKVSVTSDTYSRYEKTVHNGKHYGLTHLLENGHDIRRKGRLIGRARARPHIAKAAETTINNYEKGVEAFIKKTKG